VIEGMIPHLAYLPKDTDNGLAKMLIDGDIVVYRSTTGSTYYLLASEIHIRK